MKTYEPSWWRVIAASSARALLALVGSLTVVSLLPAVLGWSPTVVLTGSMEPALPVGSVLVSKEVPPEKLEPGQVLTVDDPDQPGRLRSHRLVEIKADGDLVLRGDANQADDSTPVSPSAVRGVGALAVPVVGLPVAWWAAGQHGHLLALALLLGLAIAGRRADKAPPDGADQTPPPRQLPWRRAAVAGAATTVVAALVVTGAPFAGQSYAAFAKSTTNDANSFAAAAVLRAYRAAVLADNPYLYWRLDESSGTTAADSSSNGTRAGTYAPSYTLGQASPITGEPADRAVAFNGGALTQNASQTAPTTFSIEAWVKTTTTAGGRILGFGSGSGTNPSGTDDRHLYVNTSGRIVFGVGTSGSGTNVRTRVTSPGGYNDGAWHHVVGTFSPSGSQRMKLYVDGAQVATSTTSVATASYAGYWRAAAEDLSEWTGGGSGMVLNGTLDELAVYTTVLSATRVSAHYAARSQ